MSIIEINCLRKKYHNDYALNDVSFSIDNCGIVSLFGPSGCGKTTILNIISGLISKYTGSVKVFGKEIRDLQKEELINMRSEKISYIHQFPNLFSDMKIIDYLKFGNSLSKREIKDVSRKYGIDGLLNKKGKYLSGGEKQRVSIIRCILQQTKILLFDEPCGNLDEKNAKDVYELIKKISKTKCIILVSHDLKAVKTYSDKIIYLEDGKIINTECINYNNTKPFLHKYKREYKLGSYIKSVFRNHKIRNFISILTLCVTFLSSSIMSLISGNIKNGIRSAFGEYFSETDVLLKSKNTPKFTYESISSESLDSILNDNIDCIESKGFFYENNFDNFFEEQYISFSSFDRSSIIDGYKVGHFNEFRTNIPDYEYSMEKYMEDDEIVISMNEVLMYQACGFYRIEKSFDSLFKYVKEGKARLSIFVKNSQREYDDEQIFKIVGFVVQSEKIIYHNNPDFNSILFEEKMKLPSYTYYDVHNPPWSLKKTAVLNYFGDGNKLFSEFITNDLFSSYYFNHVTNEYFTHTLKENEEYKSILIYQKPKEIDIEKILKILLENNYEDYIYLSNGGYLSSGASFLNGFSSNIYFSNDVNKLDNIIDNYDSINDKNSEVENKIFDKVLTAGYRNSFVNHIELKINNKELYKVNEIGISTKISNELQLFKGDNLEFVSSTNEKFTENGIEEEFKYGKLIIREIVNDDSYSIYQNSSWSTTFFRDYLKLRYEKIYPNGLLLKNIKEPKAKLKILSTSFPDINISCPMLEINENIEKTMSSMEKGVSIFSYFSILMSITLICIVVSMVFMDIKKDVANIMCIGGSTKVARDMVFFYIIKLLLLSLLPTLICLFGSVLVISNIFGMSLANFSQMNEILFSLLKIFPILSIFLVIAFLQIKSKINTLNILEELK